MTIHLGATALATANAAVGGSYRETEIERLRTKRSDLLESKPEIRGPGWATAVGGFGGIVLGSAVGAAVGPAIFKDTGKYGNYMKWGLVGRQMGVAVGIGIAGAVGGALLLNHLTKPKGAERDAIVAQHQADVKRDVAVIDRQLEALGADIPG